MAVHLRRTAIHHFRDWQKRSALAGLLALLGRAAILLLAAILHHQRAGGSGDAGQRRDADPDRLPVEHALFAERLAALLFLEQDGVGGIGGKPDLIAVDAGDEAAGI
jgi:hypothetical protein